MTDLVPVRRALISLSDKSGLDGLAAGLARHNIEIVSTGGTAAKLRELGAGRLLDVLGHRDHDVAVAVEGHQLVGVGQLGQYGEAQDVRGGGPFSQDGCVHDPEDASPDGRVTPPKRTDDPLRASLTCWQRSLPARLRRMPLPTMYGDLAPWFHLLTPPGEYEDEAAEILTMLREGIDGRLETLLELGSGGGNVASRLRSELRLTLTDLSPAMLALSRTINPDLEHISGDMRTLRLGRVFDAVLIHDAICYMTTESDLRAAMTTAFEHLRPGGVAILEPDYVRETFEPSTDHGGSDSPDGPGRPLPRGLRYLEWVSDPDPTDSTYQVDYAILVRNDDGHIDIHHDQHVEGLFSRSTWLRLLRDVGFDARDRVDGEKRVVFVARRPITEPHR